MKVRPAKLPLFIMQQHTESMPRDGKFEPRVKIDHQSFAIGVPMSRSRADWYRWQASVALARLVSPMLLSQQCTAADWRQLYIKHGLMPQSYHEGKPQTKTRRRPAR